MLQKAIRINLVEREGGGERERERVWERIKTSEKKWVVKRLGFGVRLLEFGSQTCLY